MTQPNSPITYLIADSYGRTIVEPREVERLYGATDLDAVRRVARDIDCPCGVWICPSEQDDDGNWVSAGPDEEIHPARED